MSSYVYCIGELLIDMFCTDVDVSLKDGENFKKKTGGAPANVAATVAKLGGQAYLAGKVGQDSLGDYLIETMNHYQVNTNMVGQDNVLPTTLAFVSITKDGERDFQFNRGADQNLQMSDLNISHILNSKIIHFGSATALLEGKFQTTYFTLMEKSVENDVYVSFDPNYRQDLWKGNIDSFIELSTKALTYADFVKVSEEELLLITKETHIEQGIRKCHELGIKLVTVTMGQNGTIVSNGERQELIPSISVNSIDSTGAGDAFVGAMLYQLANNYLDIKNIDYPSITDAVYFANKVGATVCEKIGSLTALPTLEEVNLLVEN